MSDAMWFVVAAVVKSAVAIGALLTAFAYMTLIERRVIARFQSRIGPNRTGPLGLLQPLADGMKMAFKEQLTPARARRIIFLMAPNLSVFVALAAFAVVPLGGPATWGSSPIARAWAPFVADVNVGVLYILSISSLAVYGIVLGGWSSGNSYSLLGALRSAAQMVSYEVSIGLSFAGVLMFAGTLSMVGIVTQQVQHGLWFILVQPLGFFLYGVAATAEVNRAPFDLPEAEQELVAGYLTEFSGLRWSLYQMAEYINMITVSSVAATLFFGGWTMGSLSGIPGLPFVWYALKVAVFLFLPLSVLNLLVTAAVIAFGWPWWLSGVFGAVVLVTGAVVLLQRRRAAQPATTKTTNAGVPLPDSVRLMRVEPTAAVGGLVEEASKVSSTTTAVTS